MAKTSLIYREGRRKYPVRVRNRCKLCGRPRGYIRRFQLCLLALPDGLRCDAYACQT